MKVAILISGRQRFTREFDDFLNSLSNYNQLDWYFLLWNTTHEQDVRIPPNWPIEVGAVRNHIQSRLPAKSNIVHLSIEEPPVFDETKSYNLTPWTIASHTWTMYYGIYHVNQIREQHGPYDLVIRTRPDIGITETLDLVAIHQQLILNPTTVLTPRNHRYGMHGGAPISDLFGIALPDVMSIYADAFNQINDQQVQGIPFTGESVLAYHLTQKGIQYPLTNFHSVMRLYTNHGGPYVDDSNIEYGKWNQP